MINTAAEETLLMQLPHSIFLKLCDHSNKATTSYRTNLTNCIQVPVWRGWLTDNWSIKSCNSRGKYNIFSCPTVSWWEILFYPKQIWVRKLYYPAALIQHWVEPLLSAFAAIRVFAVNVWACFVLVDIEISVHSSLWINWSSVTPNRVPLRGKDLQ